MVLSTALTLAVLLGQHGLAPRSSEPVWLRIDEMVASLDGIHQHRIPTLKAHGGADGPGMVVAVYERTDEGEEVVGTEEGDDVRVERVIALPRGVRALVLRTGNGGSCLGCSFVHAYRVRGRRLEPIAPKRSVRDLIDIDGDSVPEALVPATRLIGYAGIDTKWSPVVDQVWAWRGDRYVLADREYARYHWKRLNELRRSLERSRAYGQEQLGLAISLYFEHEILDAAEDGWILASRFIRQIKDRGDRVTAMVAEEALRSLEARTDR